MNESYAEAGCKRKDTAVTYLIRAGLVIAAAAIFLLTVQSQLFMFVGAIAIVAVIYIFPRLNIEYE